MIKGKDLCPIESYLKVVQARLIYGYQPKIVKRSIIGDMAISIVKAYDTNMYETAVSKLPDCKWCIVEEYENYDDSLDGHEKWEKNIQEGQKEFVDVHTEGKRQF